MDIIHAVTAGGLTVVVFVLVVIIGLVMVGLMDDTSDQLEGDE